ncbi:MAG: glutamate racemase, partial [Burkholderiaceae bacterium]
MTAIKRGAIGVFDSGVGGLSTLHAIRDAYPHEHLVYVADSGHAPYGNQSAEAIIARSTRITQFLLDQSCKAVVVACNTASVVALPAL